jgi:type II secretory pathway pseudopilin PulG
VRTPRSCFVTPIRRPPHAPTHSTGFTLIELLLVIVIMMLAAAMAVPAFVRSYRGAKLRTSARAVVMSHRYARGMAVLKQVDVAVLYDAKKNTIEIVSVTDTVAARHHDQVSEARAQQAEAVANASPDGAAQPAPQTAGGVLSELVRPLADGVHISHFESDKVEQEKDGIYWVNYYRNGMCDPYSIEIQDEYHKSAVVTVDPLSGKAKVEYD